MTNLVMVSPVLACHGDISIIKETNVDTDEKFKFSGDLGAFELGQNGQKISEYKLGDRLYIIEEEIKEGWELKDIICTGDTTKNSVVDLVNNKILIQLENLENIVCTFYNEKIETEPICGDGIIEGEEICDAGILNDDICQADYNDTCSYCNNTCELIEIIGGFCGDEIVNGEEECDFNDQISNTNCSSECTIVVEDYCGDNIINNDEICDDGDDNGLVCDPLYGEECNYCSIDCKEITVKGPNCGDSEINGVETCDDGLNNGNICNPLYGETCSYCNDICETKELVGAFCGDNILQDEEECDGDLGLEANQSCSETCTIINIEHCGDTIVNNNEECDLGQDNNGLACTADYGETCTYCSDTCTNITVTGPSCGDEIVNGDEECDGTQGISGDQTCTNLCAIETPEPNSFCGDNTVDTGEECDDGNTTNGDGCNSNCQTESYCGDDSCDSNESCSNCSDDCGSCGGGTPLCVLRGNCGQPFYQQPEEIIVLAEVGAPYLNMGKIVKQKYAQAGDTEIEYTIFLSNDGNMPVFNVQVVDELPEGMFFSSDGSSSKTWDIGDMPSGDIESIHYSVYLSDTLNVNTLVNTAITYSDNYDVLSAQATLLIEASPEIITETVEILPVTGFSNNEMLTLSFLAMLSFGSIARLRKYQNI